MEQSWVERRARNEAFFREVNERINDAAERYGDADHAYVFMCECSDATCRERVTMSQREYERVRAGANRFVLAKGHTTPAIEHVVARTPDYVVVEKDGLAGSVAAGLDPRSD